MKKLNAPICGVYQIKNLTTGECYIGTSTNVQRRLYDHMKNLVNNSHINRLMQNSWNEHGVSNFSFSVVEVVHDPHLLAEKEKAWIGKTDALDNGFNTKTDIYKEEVTIRVFLDTKRKLEELRIGSMNSTLKQLVKHYAKHCR